MKYMAIPAVTFVLVSSFIYAAAMGYVTHQPTPEEIADDIVAQINTEREALGLEPLLVNDHLVQIARWRSEDMVASGYFGHYPPEGHPTLGDLGARLGYGWFIHPVENLVTMRLTFGRRREDVAERAVDSWRSSRGHWMWLVDPQTKVHGVGVAVGDGYVVGRHAGKGAPVYPRALMSSPVAPDAR
jgi:uncharacterized protein YkwD